MLELLIEYIHDAFRYFYPVIQRRIRRDESIVLYVLVRLTARACRTAQEILVLLKNVRPYEKLWPQKNQLF